MNLNWIKLFTKFSCKIPGLLVVANVSFNIPIKRLFFLQLKSKRILKKNQKHDENFFRKKAYFYKTYIVFMFKLVGGGEFIFRLFRNSVELARFSIGSRKTVFNEKLEIFNSLAVQNTKIIEN